MSSPEPSVASAPESKSEPDDHGLSLFDRDGADPSGSSNGGNGSARGGVARATPIVPITLEPPGDDTGPPTTELEFDDPVLSGLSPSSAAPLAVPVDEPDDWAEDDDIGYLTLAEEAELGYREDEGDFTEAATGVATRGKLKARKVRRVVRYVSPWSVLKVSLVFYACLWVIGTVAMVILWRVAAETGGIANVEKFISRLFGENSFTLDGREIFRASTVAGVILVFAGTGFTVLMALLFNVICDITGGIRFTVLELESTKRRVKRKRSSARSA